MNETLEFENAVISSLIVGPLMTNCFVLGCKATRQGAIIDSGENAKGLLGLADEHELELGKLLQTHAHIDHVAALHIVKAATHAPIYLHPDDQRLYDAAPLQGRMFGYQIEPLPPVDEALSDGQLIEVGNLRAEVIHLPGHSPGSVAFWFRELNVVFSGDVLFAGSIGRVDLPGSDPDAMRRSLKRIVELPDETAVLSGHGPRTTIGMEKRRNPFLLQEW